MNRLSRMAALGGLLVATAAPAFAVNVTLTKLTGLTGGSPAATAVYKADLSAIGIASVLSVSIVDSNSGIGGSPGQFSGFDLDAIRLSTVDCADAACAAAALPIAVFDFGAGTSFTPGTQRAPADPKLFGTGPTGLTVEDAVATLGAFDADSSVVTPDGFISLGDGGRINFNLLAAVSTAGLFLYIGEVGDNGEVADGSIIVRENRVPLPGTAALALMGVVGLARRPRGVGAAQAARTPHRRPGR